MSRHVSEYDINTNTTSEHIFKPTDNVLRMFHQSFIDIDGKTNFNKRLHIDLDQQIKFKQVVDFNLDRNPDANIQTKEIKSDSGEYFSYYDFDELKNKYMNPIRKLFYHYMVMGYQRWNNDTKFPYSVTGQAEIIGNDLVIAYSFKTKYNGNVVAELLANNTANLGINLIGPEEKRLGVMLHELGHNMGLLHNGNNKKSENRYDYDKYMSDIHMSVMNYRYMQYGVGGDSDRKINSGVYSYSSGNELSTVNGFITRRINDYTSVHGYAEGYTLGNGSSFVPWGVCRKNLSESNKVWPAGNSSHSCSNQTYSNDPTCDCDVVEWNYLWTNFWFDWDGRIDLDIWSTKGVRIIPELNTNTLNKVLANMKANSYKRKNDLLYKYTSVPGEFTVDSFSKRVLSDD